MSEIIDQFYTPLLIEHGFIRDPDNQQYGALGDCWKLSPEVGEGTYWTYGQKDLYDIKIHERQKCLSPAKKYKLYKSSINKSIHFVQRSLSSSTRVQRVTAQLNLSRE